MSLLNLIFLLLTLNIATPVKSYIYPIWGSIDDKKDDVENSARDDTVTEFLVNNFLLPMKDGLCNICVNFLEVYECVADGNYFGDKKSQDPDSYIEHILELFGLFRRDSTSPQKCSYYAIIVVTASILLFIGLIVATKKLVDYFKEEELVFHQMFYDYRNKCPCFKRG